MPALCIEERPVAIAAFGKGELPAIARLRVWGRGERMGRAAKGLLVYWALAAAGAFIPVAHLFLVPGFLIGGIVVGLRRSGEVATFEDVRGACPLCGVEGEFGVRGKFALPRETDCAGCGGRISVRSSPGAGRAASGPARREARGAG